MASEQIMIDTDLVGQAINNISQLTANISAANKRFMDLLQEKMNQTQGRNQVIKTLASNMERETQNFQAVLAAQESIVESINKFIELVNDADDDSGLRIPD